MASTNFFQSLGALILADEVVAAAPSLETFFHGASTAGTDPAKWILLLNQLGANLGAAQIGAVGEEEQQLSGVAMTFLTNLVTKEQAVIAAAQPAPAAPAA